jgi:hypothetical protein
MNPPVKLQIVATLFVLCGISSIITFIIKLSQGALYLPFDILGFPIAYGLLHFRSGWRTLALVFIWIALIFIPVLMILGVFTPNRYFEIFGIKVAEISLFSFLLIVSAVYALIIWQYRVLTDPEVSILFKRA